MTQPDAMEHRNKVIKGSENVETPIWETNISETKRLKNYTVPIESRAISSSHDKKVDLIQIVKELHAKEKKNYKHFIKKLLQLSAELSHCTTFQDALKDFERTLYDIKKDIHDTKDRAENIKIETQDLLPHLTEIISMYTKEWGRLWNFKMSQD